MGVSHDLTSAERNVPRRVELSSELLPRLRARDESAFREVVDQASAALIAFAASIVGTMDAGQDVVQDVLYRIWQQADRFDPKGSIAAYLFTAVRRRALDVLAHERVVVRSQPAVLAELSHMEQFRQLPIERLVHEEHLASLRAAIQELTEHQRSALALRYGQGMTIPEIATVLEISPKGAERLMTRVRQLLRDAVMPRDGDG